MLEGKSISIDVSALLRQPGTTKGIELDAHVPGLSVGLGRVADDGAVHADLLLESLVEGILVSGELSGTFDLECSRCLTSFSIPFTAPVSEVYAYPDQPEFDEGFVIAGEEIDAEPMIRDEVLLAIPLSPLHDEACKGLCATCGHDLNTGDCGHVHEPVDIRWEPLRKLKEKGLGQ